MPQPEHANTVGDDAFPRWFRGYDRWLKPKSGTFAPLLVLVSLHGCACGCCGYCGCVCGHGMDGPRVSRNNEAKAKTAAEAAAEAAEWAAAEAASQAAADAAAEATATTKATASAKPTVKAKAGVEANDKVEARA